MPISGSLKNIVGHLIVAVLIIVWVHYAGNFVYHGRKEKGEKKKINAQK
jgi:hypothetical protein